MDRRRLRVSERGSARRSRRVPMAALAVAGIILGSIALGTGLAGVRRGEPGPVQREVAVATVTSSPAPAHPATSSVASVEVPDVVGRRIEDAGVVLAAAGLDVAVATSEATNSASADPGAIVQSQEPEARTLVSSGTAVTVTLAAPRRPAAARSEGAEPAADEARPESNGPWVVCIDPGHQAKSDSSPEPVGPGASETKARVTGGATGVRTGIPEYEIVLQISTNLKQRLEERGVKVVMTRSTNDVNVSNSERAVIANRAKADLFIRVHCDGSPDAEMSGLSTLYPGSNRWTNGIATPSLAAARMVHRSTVSATGAVDRGLKKRTDLSGFNWSKVPTVLVECGFLSNPVEDRLLASPHYQDKLATGMAEGVIAYLESTRR